MILSFSKLNKWLMLRLIRIMKLSKGVKAKKLVIKIEKLQQLPRLKMMLYLLGGVAYLVQPFNNLMKLLRSRNRHVNKFKTMSIKCIRIIYRLLQLKLLQN